MATKLKPLGICDFCGGAIERRQWYTSKGLPRLYCCLEHKQTANSRNGNPKRVEKVLKRVAAGLWKNPRAGLAPEKLRELQAAAAKKGRLRERAEGRWRNPALAPTARQKLSRPRKHDGVLHAALEKLRQGIPMADLTDEEREAHRAYRRALKTTKKPLS